MTTDATFGTVGLELAEEKAIMGMSSKLRILRAAADLGTFTQPELATVSGTSYEMVKKVLKAEHATGRFVRLEQTEVRPTGRPRIVWRVADQTGLERELADASDDAEDTAVKLRTVTEDPPMQSPLLEAVLSAAEDHLVFAVGSPDAGDIADLALDAMAELERFESVLAACDPTSPTCDPVGSGGAPGTRRRRNVPVPIGRAQVVRAMSEYLASDEALGVEGPLWRNAFDTVGGFDHARQAGLHKLLMTGLVDIADQRRTTSASGGALAGAQGVSRLPERWM